jgi:hypothetical protein
MSTSRADPKLNILVRGRYCTRPLHLAGDRKNIPQNLGVAFLYVSADTPRLPAEI